MFIKHTFIYFLSKGIPGILSFLGILYYSRMLNPSEYGVYSLIISVVGIINIIFFDWFRFGMSRFLPEYIAEHRRDEFLLFTKNKVQLATIILSLVTLIIYLIFPSAPIDGIESWMVLLIAFLSLLQYLFTLFTQIFVTELKPITFMWSNLIKSLLGVILGMLFVFLGFGYIGLLFGLIISYALSIVYSLIKIKFPKSSFKFSIDKKLLKQVTLYSLPLSASAGLSFILSYSNRFIINEFRGVNETGLFSLGFDFSQQTIGVFISIAATSAFPIAMKLYTEDGNSNALKNHMNKSLLLLFIIALPIVIIFCTTSFDLSTLLLGKKFAKLNYLVLPIISFNAFVLGLKSFYFDLFFYLKKDTKFQLLILFIVAIINIVLNVIYVPQYGYIAAIWSGLITSAIAVISTYFITRRILYIPIQLVPIFKICLSALIMGFTMYLFGSSKNLMHLILKVGTGIGIFICFVIVFNRKSLQTILSRS